MLGRPDFFLITSGYRGVIFLRKRFYRRTPLLLNGYPAASLYFTVHIYELNIKITGLESEGRAFIHSGMNCAPSRLSVSRRMNCTVPRCTSNLQTLAWDWL